MLKILLPSACLIALLSSSCVPAYAIRELDSDIERAKTLTAAPAACVKDAGGPEGACNPATACCQHRTGATWLIFKEDQSESLYWCVPPVGAVPPKCVRTRFVDTDGGMNPAPAEPKRPVQPAPLTTG